VETNRTHTWIVVVLLMLFAGGALDALAQVPAGGKELPPIDLFGGYSYQRLNSTYGRDAALNGWATDAQVNVNRSFALATSFSGGYGNQLGADLRLYTFLAGPRLTYRGNGANVFAHALLGGARLNASAAGIPDTSTSFAAVVGGGVDLKLSRCTAVRLFQTDYLVTRLAGNTQHNFRFSTGIVLRLGGRQR
jgi:hypothetical protein